MSLRVSFFILVTICLFAFKNNYNNLGYFIAVTCIMLSIIVINDFTISSSTLSVSKYYFFGLFRIKWHFNKGDKLKITSLGSDFGQDGEIPDYDRTASGLGCLFSILSLFSKSQIIIKEVKIVKLNEVDKVTKSVYINLDRYEFKQLQTYIQQSHST